MNVEFFVNQGTPSFKSRLTEIIKNGKDILITASKDTTGNLPTNPAFVQFSCSKNPENKIGHFYVCQLTGCCGVGVITQLYVYPAFQHKGVGSLLLAFAEELLFKKCYTVAQVTTVNPNYILGILTKRKYERHYTFRNRNTNNNVECWSKKLELPTW